MILFIPPVVTKYTWGRPYILEKALHLMEIFRFVRFIGVCCEQENLTDNTVKVLKLSKYNISGLGNGYIRIRGSIVFLDGEEGKIDFNMAFDKAIEGLGSIPSEMIVPAEFRSKPKMDVSDEIAKLYK